MIKKQVQYKTLLVLHISFHVIMREKWKGQRSGILCFDHSNVMWLHTTHYLWQTGDVYKFYYYIDKIIFKIIKERMNRLWLEVAMSQWLSLTSSRGWCYKEQGQERRYKLHELISNEWGNNKYILHEYQVSLIPFQLKTTSFIYLLFTLAHF
jgi:hypothetical protein